MTAGLINRSRVRIPICYLVPSAGAQAAGPKTRTPSLAWERQLGGNPVHSLRAALAPAQRPKAAIKTSEHGLLPKARLLRCAERPQTLSHLCLRLSTTMNCPTEGRTPPNGVMNVQPRATLEPYYCFVASQHCLMQRGRVSVEAVRGLAARLSRKTSDDVAFYIFGSIRPRQRHRAGV
jgi:hypothetical protein